MSDYFKKNDDFFSDTNMNQRSTLEVMLLVSSALAAVLLSPFVYLRYTNDDFIVAAIDAFIILLLVIFFVFVYFTRKVDIAKTALAILLTIAILTVVIIRGESHLYWIYPAIIAFYYMLNERAAGIICLFGITVIALRVYPELSLLDFSTVITSLLLTSFLAYIIFSNYRKTNDKLLLLATIDPLTSAGNRRALNNKLERILADQQREASNVSLMLLDLDHFKKINDNYGHANGDRVLKELVQLIKSETRALDALYRYGGEEFIILPLKVNLQAAKHAAENLRQAIFKTKFADNLSITVSIGVAQYRALESAESWISRADAALYVAKKAGRNRVMTEAELNKTDALAASNNTASNHKN